jgi:hypothetical protein
VRDQSRFVATSCTLIVAGQLLATAGCGRSAESTEANEPQVDVAAKAAPEPTAPAAPGAGEKARREAAENDKYLFAFFQKADDAETASMRSVFEKALPKIGDRADSVVVDITNPNEKAIVDEFDLSRAPMPLVLAIAPNGAITGGFPGKCSEEDLLGAFATPCTQNCMKFLQSGKLVFLCVQNDQTKSKDEAMEGVRQFAADERFSSATEIVTLDPKDSAEEGFLSDLEIEPDTESSVTILLVPPGSPIGKFEGPTNKDQLVDLLMKASSACGPGGCGPGGCGPAGCPPQ